MLPSYSALLSRQRDDRQRLLDQQNSERDAIMATESEITRSIFLVHDEIRQKTYNENLLYNPQFVIDSMLQICQPDNDIKRLLINGPERVGKSEWTKLVNDIISSEHFQRILFLKNVCTLYLLFS